MVKKIDVCGLSCPQPVLETKKALENGGFDVLEILVDNDAAKENVQTLIKKLQFEIISVSTKEGITQISVQGNDKKQQEVKNQKIKSNDCKCGQTKSDKIIFIASNQIGSGSEELGKMLMKAYTYALTELPQKVEMLIFMNAGVKLCVDGSESLPNLKELEEKGISILVCGTCLNFYHLQDKLAVGKISNMYDITENLLSEREILTIS